MGKRISPERMAGLLFVLMLHAVALYGLWSYRLLPSPAEAMTVFVNFINPPPPDKPKPARKTAKAARCRTRAAAAAGGRGSRDVTGGTGRARSAQYSSRCDCRSGTGPDRNSGATANRAVSAGNLGWRFIGRLPEPGCAVVSAVLTADCRAGAGRGARRTGRKR